MTTSSVSANPIKTPKRGDLLALLSGQTIVMVDSYNGISFSGTVVFSTPNSVNILGSSSDNWDSDKFKPFLGQVTLKSI